jgi:hypothetical protein
MQLRMVILEGGLQRLGRPAISKALGYRRYFAAYFVLPLLPLCQLPLKLQQTLSDA